jgi:hypothetical protein
VGGDSPETAKVEVYGLLIPHSNMDFSAWKDALVPTCDSVQSILASKANSFSYSLTRKD